MKKYISIVLALALCLGLFAGCTQPEEPVNPLKNATSYLFQMYNNAGKGEANKLTSDKDVTSVVVYDGTNLSVEWTVEITSGPADSVKITESSTANSVKIDVPDQPEEDIFYTLTATVKDDKGNSESVSFLYFTPAVKKVDVSTDGKMVLYYPNKDMYVTDEVYEYTSSSSGKTKNELVLTSDEASAVALTVQNNDDGTISLVTDDGRYLFCDATNVHFADEQGDFTKFVLEESTMEGVENGVFIKCAVANFNGKAQYLEVYGGDYVTCYGMGDAPIYTFVLKESNAIPASAILDAAYGLGKGESLAGGPYTLTGVISSIDTAWSEDYKNITVTIVCGGDTERPMKCYCLQGEGAKDLAVGDTITVTGEIKNYEGTIEFDAKCNLDKVVKGEGNTTPPADEEPTTPPADDEPTTPPSGDTTDMPLTNGMQVVIYNPAHGKALSSQMTGYYQAGVDVTLSGETLTGWSDTEVWNVIVNADGTVSFAQGGQNLAMGAEFSSMKLGEVNDDWQIISLGDGLYLIKNTVRGNCIEWYSEKGNWSSYNKGYETNDLFHLAFYVVK